MKILSYATLFVLFGLVSGIAVGGLLLRLFLIRPTCRRFLWHRGVWERTEEVESVRYRGPGFTVNARHPVEQCEVCGRKRVDRDTELGPGPRPPRRPTAWN